MRKWLRRIVPIVIALLVVAAIVYGFWPQPVEVDLAEVGKGPMRVTVNEEGKTRIRERYIVSAPLAGSLLRVQLKAGSEVKADQTVLAILEPTDPAFLNPRERAEAEARVKSAEASAEEAGARVAAAKKEYDLAQVNLKRVTESRKKGAASQEDFDSARIREQVRAEQVRGAEFSERFAQFQLKLYRAALLRTDPKSALPPEEARMEITAPVGGKVLRVYQESAAVVTPGTKIIEIGDPEDLEMVIDVLSTDAVKVSPGDPIVVERWGGDHPLHGRVRLVEPAAFLKRSALGVEEQRVNIIGDFTDPVEQRRQLGDEYRIEAHIVIWEEPDVVKVPSGALFRSTSGDWAVFAVRQGRATLTTVKVGRSNGIETQILEGLSPGDRVVLHPSDRVKNGVEVSGR